MIALKRQPVSSRSRQHVLGISALVVSGRKVIANDERLVTVGRGRSSDPDLLARLPDDLREMSRRHACNEPHSVTDGKLLALTDKNRKH